MMKVIADHLSKIRDQLRRGHGLAPPDGTKIRSAIEVADRRLGTAVVPSLDIKIARAKLMDAVETATATAKPGSERDTGRIRDDYRKALAALHGYSLILDAATLTPLAATGPSAVVVPNPLPPGL
ncbi:hypothetical protein, partial [Methylobacterium sp. E-046]|uniref:hypothetical protein n=1 Tax=Methylobacterium sp. E-046 TaxID=2836576 RepID=UPI001FB9F10C